MTPNLRYEEKPWLKFYDPGVPESIEFEEILLHEYLEAHSSSIPDHTALIFQGYRFSFREFNEAADAFAAFLQGQGVKKGDAVAILLPNVIPCVVAYYATLRIGAIVVLNNPLYSDRELEHQFTDSNSSFLITLDLLADRMVKLRGKTRIKTIVYTSIGDYLPFAKRWSN